jgi:hypothetical protein
MEQLNSLTQGIPFSQIQSYHVPQPSIPQAPNRTPKLNPKEFQVIPT